MAEKKNKVKEVGEVKGFTVYENAPLPPAPEGSVSRVSKWPFRQMIVGQSVPIPFEGQGVTTEEEMDKLHKSVSGAASAVGRSNRNKAQKAGQATYVNFATRRLEKSIGVWCVEADTPVDQTIAASPAAPTEPVAEDGDAGGMG